MVCCLVDYIDCVFGLDESKLYGYFGYLEIELVLMCLYEVIEELCYLVLMNYFVE